MSMRFAQKNKVLTVLATGAFAAIVATSKLYASEPRLPATPYMGGPVELVKAPNGAIANKRILDLSLIHISEPTSQESRSRKQSSA